MISSLSFLHNLNAIPKEKVLLMLKIDCKRSCQKIQRVWPFTTYTIGPSLDFKKHLWWTLYELSFLNKSASKIQIIGNTLIEYLNATCDKTIVTVFSFKRSNHISSTSFGFISVFTVNIYPCGKGRYSTILALLFIVEKEINSCYVNTAPIT